MKTATDPRHQTRIKRVQSLFSYTFQNTSPDPTIADIIHKLPILDEKIKESAPEWPLAKMNRLDLAVLRQAVYELHYSDTPAKVVVDEAVEIAKKYGSENSSSLVNGVLGTIMDKKE